MKLSFSCTALLGFTLFSSTAYAEEPFVLNFGTVAPDGTPWAEQLKNLESRIEKESNGRVQVNLFMGGSLGSEREMIQDVKRGERLQGGGFSTGAVGAELDVPELTMLELPYLFNNRAEADTILDTVLYDATKKALAEKGVTFYAWSENGWRCFATKGGPATSPEELTKYKMRSQESSVHLDMYKAMNVQAVAKPVSEVLPSLNTGIVTGFDNTPLFSIAAGWIQPVTHYTLSRHIYQPAAVMYSKSFIESLPEDLKTIVLSNPQAESKRGRDGVRMLETGLIDTIKEMGISVVDLTPEQNKAFRKAVRKPTHAAFLAQNPKMQALYGTVKKTLKSLRKK
jgi:TRAP-type C4-dicarboxylate transport system substrate-binding protein